VSNRPSPPGLRECIDCSQPTVCRDHRGAALCQLCAELEHGLYRLCCLGNALELRWRGFSAGSQAAQHPLYLPRRRPMDGGAQ